MSRKNASYHPSDVGPISPTLHLGRSYRTLLSHLYLRTRHRQPIHFSTTHSNLISSLPLSPLSLSTISSRAVTGLSSSTTVASHSRPRWWPLMLISTTASSAYSKVARSASASSTAMRHNISSHPSSTATG